MIKLIAYDYARHFSGWNVNRYEIGEVSINPKFIESVAPVKFSIGKYETKTVRGLFKDKEVREFVFDYEDNAFKVVMQSGVMYYFKEDPTEIKQPKEKADN